MDEISVLDYLKFRLNPKNIGKEILPEEGVIPGFPEFPDTGAPNPSGNREGFSVYSSRISSCLTSVLPFHPLYLLLAVLFALAAQLVLEPTILSRSAMSAWIGGGLYALCAFCVVLAYLLRKKEAAAPERMNAASPEEPSAAMEEESQVEELAAAMEEKSPVEDPAAVIETESPSDAASAEAEAFFTEESPAVDGTTLQGSPARERKANAFDETLRPVFLFISFAALALAFLLFGGNRFNILNLSCWALSFVFAVLAFEADSLKSSFSRRVSLLKENVRSNGFPAPLRIRFSFWNCLCIGVFALCAFFLFYQIDEIPMEMVSDHAEKLYDIKDILDGQSPIFFTRNTGRECFQFYFTVLIIKIFNTGVTFLSLKIGTALAGLFILPFVYQLGKLLANRKVGLLTMLLCGVSYWPIVIGRAALRFAYYPMFTAPVLYFFIKGMKEKNRGALIWCGIFTGIGLHGYSPFRIVPVALAIFFLLFLLREKRELRTNTTFAFLVMVYFALILFIPLGRVMVDMPEMVMYRAMTRLGQAEKSFDASPLLIFLQNFWKGLVMPFWNDGSTWVHSIVYRPALDHLSAAFFFIGTMMGLLRVVTRRRWEDLVILLSIPLLMLPSTLSLAFPQENPCLNRTGGALIPVMYLTALGFCFSFEVFFAACRENLPRLGLTAVCFGLLLLNIVSHNYDLIFKQYAYDYGRASWNTSQIGSVIRGFAESVGSYQNAYVIPYPYWVDTRLVGINAGDPGRDYALDQSMLSSLPDTGSPYLFIYRESDTEAAQTVRSRFPNGVEQLHKGPYDGKNFCSYITLSSAQTQDAVTLSAVRGEETVY